MSTPEKKVKEAIKRALKKYKVYYFMPATGGYGRSGVPDFICCAKGKFLAIEAKAGDNQLTALQAKEIESIREAGGVALVFNEETVLDIELHIRWWLSC
jgi:Holliday junction resolvase